MHTESVILVEVLSHLKAKGIVALGLHDGLLVPLVEADAARTTMEEVGRKVSSMSIPVTMATLG